MARHAFGGGISDWAFTAGGSDEAVLVAGATVTFHNAETGGSQYTDLAEDAAGTMPIDHVTSEDGTGTRGLGQIPPFYGPDGITVMWASADGGPRVLVVASDLGTAITDLEADVSSLETSLTSHAGQANPHATELGDLADVDVSGVGDGEVLTYDSGAGNWVPSAVSGGAGGMTLDTDQTVEGTKTFTPDSVNDTGIKMVCNTGQVGDIFSCETATGQRTGYFNEKGELRAISAAANSVAVRFKGVAAQTANILEITDISNNAMAWFEPDGHVKAPNISVVPPFSMAGALATGAGTLRWYNDTGTTLTIRSVRASVGTAPTGASVIVDVNVNGTTIFATQANRPTIAVSTNTHKTTGMSDTTIADGEYITVDLDQIGSTVEGADLTVQILAY